MLHWSSFCFHFQEIKINPHPIQLPLNVEVWSDTPRIPNDKISTAKEANPISPVVED